MAFKIWNDGDYGRDCHIEIDGEDVSGKFQSLTVTADLKSAVKIEMDMPIAEVPVDRMWRGDDQPVRLIFPIGGTRELLIKHGWTPPED